MLVRLDASTARMRYHDGKPWPHIVIDDFLPAEAAEEVYAGFGSFDRDVWRRSEHPNSVKLACNKLEQMPEPIQRTLSFFNSAELLESVGAITVSAACECGPVAAEHGVLKSF